MSHEEARGYEAYWRVAAERMATEGLAGLGIHCPKCHSDGTLVSKWRRGTSIKPLFVVHTDGNGYFKACRLSKEEAASARAAISITSHDVLKMLRIGKPFVLFSGGRDSVCTLAYLDGLARRMGRRVTALHANTTAGFPEVEQYVQDVCELLDVELVTVHPEHDFFDIAKRWGIPGVKSRWCCKTLKVAPIRRFLSTVQEPKVIFDGIRAAESPIRATYIPIWFHPAFRCFSVSAIFHWSDGKVDHYIRRSGLPENPTADLGCSGECWCGAYKRRSDFEELLAIHPEIFDKLVQVEKAQRGKFTFVYEKGERIPLTEVRKQAKRKSRASS